MLPHPNKGWFQHKESRVERDQPFCTCTGPNIAEERWKAFSACILTSIFAIQPYTISFQLPCAQNFLSTPRKEQAYGSCQYHWQRGPWQQHPNHLSPAVRGVWINPDFSGQLTLMLPDARSESSSKSAKAKSVKDILISNAAQCREALEQQQTSTFYLVARGKRLGWGRAVWGLYWGTY